jgi:hypothetical protein
MSTPSIAQLKQAVTIAEQIEQLQAELASLVGGGSSARGSEAGNGKTISAPATKRGRKRKMSPETIAKMKAAQQARWARKKGASVAPASAPKADTKPAAGSKKKKSGLSPEGRAKIVAALKARWAAKKKGASTPAAKAPAAAPTKKARRNVSPEARAKMAEAARRRWAAQKKTAK